MKLSRKYLPYLLSGLLGLLLVGSVFVYYQTNHSLEQEKNQLMTQLKSIENSLTKSDTELKALKLQDQYVINKKLEDEIIQINATYKKSISAYEKLQELKGKTKDTTAEDKQFASILNLLAQKNYGSASAELTTLEKSISEKEAKIAATFSIPANVPTNNAPPGSGYSRQRVTTEIGEFLVDVISADLGSTKVLVDTASEGDCRDNCPVLALSDYVSRNGAFAGINGSYFCPASYPTCAGKTNSFDTLLMNKNKKYFNSDNNVYSTVPVAAFGSGWARFMGKSSDWGRDTGVDGVIANQPLLLSGGNIAFGGDGDPKKGGKGTRSFVGANGSTVYIGVVHNATVAEVAYALKALGLKDALNLDSGGSTALWSGGYKAGPGRAIPNAILFVRR